MVVIKSRCKHLPYTFFLFFLLVGTGCSTPGSDAPASIDLAEGDKSYVDVLRAYTRTAHVYDKFETNAMVSATLLASAFQMELDQEIRRVLGGKAFSLADAEGKTAFFVSIFVPVRRMMDLANRDYWNLFLMEEGNKIFPASITRLKDKHKWKSYFGYIHAWSQEYFVVFDTPGHSLHQENLVKKHHTHLKIMGPAANISLQW
ncbi:MAG: hypothetical protein OXT67_06420 [Zetaproteobacteria bacterium]|nr:hypothetical protein [Zetaproteobacteria bacterium]